MSLHDGKREPLVFISVLNWRDPAETAACVASLAASDYPNKKIFISNNGARDSLMAELAAAGLNVEVLHNDGNLGFSGGNNVVMREAVASGADYVWLFNSDATASPDCLPRLVEVMERVPRAGLVSPVMYHDSERTVPWNSGGFFDLRTGDWGWFDDPAEAAKFAAATPERFMLPGTALLIRVAMARRIGLLDEAMFAYYEDVDYSVRAEKAGFSRQLAPDAAVFHKHDVGAQPSPHVCYYIARNETLLWRKHASIRAAMRRRLWGLSTALAGFDKFATDEARRDACLTGWWHGQLGVTGEWDPRRRIPGPVRKLLLSQGINLMTGRSDPGIQPMG